MQRQTEETLSNIAALVASARQDPEPPSSSLARLSDIRVYVTVSAHAFTIYETLLSRCCSAARIEMVVAKLCRPELLVEIEAIADL